MPKITLIQGDITTQAVDVIVNAANSSLLGGAGVDGAIHRVGGPTILQACRAVRATTWPDGLPTGQAVATTAGDLAAEWVIHTVGPIHSEREDRRDLLVSSYRESLRIADELGCSSIAFPAISMGLYGWPIDDGARVAIETIRTTSTSIQEIRFVLFNQDIYRAFLAQWIDSAP